MKTEAPRRHPAALSSIFEMETPLGELGCVVLLLRALIGSPHQLEADMLVPVINELHRLHGELESSFDRAFDEAAGKPAAEIEVGT